MSAATDPLLQPFQLGHLTLRNRIMSTAHASGMGDAEGMPAEAYQAYQEEKARGGIGLTMFGGSSNVSIDSPSIMPQLNLGTAQSAAHLQRMAERVHAQGSAVMVQITHLGRRGVFTMDAHLPTIAPSPIRETLHRSIPKEMDDHDIKRVIADYVACALRCRDAGLDGIECLAGAHLIGQFLSPAMNHRTDAYGGSVENRCRFGLELYEAMRAAVGANFLLGFRFVVDEGHADGLGFAESVEMARIFAATGHVDFFNAIYGRMDTFTGLAYDNMPGMASPDAPWLQKAAAFKTEVGLPVFHAAKIADVATARHAIREGLIDMVGMTRAHIAEPHIVNKIAAGQEDRIRPCVGATHCMGDRRPACIHNPATGNEATLRHVIARADVARRVVIVGAGPAGLEAARVCGERGHDVTLFEAGTQPGGQILLAAKASWRRSLLGIIDWRVAELGHLGVDLRCNTYADAADVAALDPDLVIIATGGVPNDGDLPGAEHLTSAWDIISGAASPAEDVLVVDGTGRHVALSAADACVRAGSKLQFAMVDETLAAEQGYAERAVWRKWMLEHGVRARQEEALIGVRREGNKLIATLRNELTAETSQISAAQVIWDYGTLPADALYHGMREGARNKGVTQLEAMAAATAQPWDGEGYELHRIGDAVSSRSIHSAVLDALRLCQNC